MDPKKGSRILSLRKSASLKVNSIHSKPVIWIFNLK